MEDSRALNNTNGLNVRICITYVVLTVVFFGVLRPSFLGGTVGICFRVLCLTVGMFFFIFNLKIRKMINMSLIYVIPVIISCVYNYLYKGLNLSNLINGLQYALCIYEIYTMFQYCDQKKTSRRLTEVLCKICGFYCFLSAVTVFIFGKSYLFSSSYFIGSKYMVSYIMMLYIGLKYNLNESLYKSNKTVYCKFIGIFVIFEIVVWYANCMTGFSALFLIFLLLHASEKAKKFLSNPAVIIGFLILSMMMIFIIPSLLKLKLVQFVVQDVMGKDLTLTDRLRYYDRAVDVYKQGGIWLGYGYESNVMRDNIALGTNIQNGLAHIMLSYGLIGGLALIIMLFRAVSISNKNNKIVYLQKARASNWALYAVIYGFIFAAVAEVSLSFIFFFTIFIIRWSENYLGFETKLKKRKIRIVA